MKSAVFQGVGKPLSIEDLPDPIVGPDDLLLKVAYCGICGTDIHCTQKSAMTMNPGTVLGHEFSGTVVEIGKNNTTEWTLGDFATAFPANGCSTCNLCLKGYSFLCKGLKITGLSDVKGAYSTLIKLTKNSAIKLPKSLDLREGALIEPLAIAHHAVDIAKIGPADDVLVLGAGPIGLAVTQFARLSGSKNVVVSEPLESRRNLALEFGATDVIDSNHESVEEQFKNMTGGNPSIIFECVGIPGLIQECVDLAQPHTKIIIAGVCMEQDTILPLSAIMKELTIQFSLGCRKDDFIKVIDLLKNRKIKALEMISDIVGFSQFPETFENLRKPKNQCKVLLNPFLD